MRNMFSINRQHCGNKQVQTKSLLLVCTLTIVMAGCATEYVGDGEDLPNTPYEEAWVDEHTGDDENLGPNSPGYLGVDGEYQTVPMIDPR
jgi:hypothetical protein